MIDKSTRQQVQQAYLAKSHDDPEFFIKGLVIPSATGPQLFGHCAADFQLKCLRDLAPSLLAVRNNVMPPIRRFWIERTKKASKDGDIGACLLWMSCFPVKPLYIQIGAADRDQAAIVKRRISDLMYHNPWLNDLVEIKQYKIHDKHGLCEIEIIPADVAGSHGETPHMLVINELSHITKWEFVKNLLDNARGVPQGLIVIATNAGIKGTPAHSQREIALGNDRWAVHILDRPAPWINEDDLLEAKQQDPNLSRYRRLWYGQWASGKGDALDEVDIDWCFKDELEEQHAREGDWVYIAGLDLGISHDHAGLVVAGIDSLNRRIRVANITHWEPPSDGEIDLMVVEDTIVDLAKKFNLQWIGYDPYEARLMAQRLRKKNLPMQEWSFSSARNLELMAVALVQVMKSKILESYPHTRLRSDLGKFNIVEKARGYKLEATRDETGHADVGTALAILLPKAVQMLGSVLPLDPDQELMYDEGPLSPEEVEQMEPELREIYEMYDENKGSLVWGDND